MKYLFPIIILFSVQSAVAQDIDSTIVFETEQVVDFEKQTLLKEFQIPYNQDVDRKRLIRLGNQSEAAYPGLGSPFIC